MYFQLKKWRIYGDMHTTITKTYCIIRSAFKFECCTACIRHPPGGEDVEIKSLFHEKHHRLKWVNPEVRPSWDISYSKATHTIFSVFVAMDVYHPQRPSLPLCLSCCLGSQLVLSFFAKSTLICVRKIRLYSQQLDYFTEALSQCKKQTTSTSGIP